MFRWAPPSELKKPALIIATTYDPMVPVEAAIMCSQTGHDHQISDEGGHVGFPSLNLDIGQTLGSVLR